MHRTIISICFILVAIVSSSPAAGDEVLLEYRFTKGRVSVYEGKVDIVDIGGIPTDVRNYGLEELALTSYGISIPFVYSEEIIDVDKDGKAVIRATRDIDVDHYSSYGRDAATAETVKRCLAFFKLQPHSQWVVSVNKNGRVSSESIGDIFYKDLPILPDKAVAAGYKQEKVFDTGKGSPVAVSWMFKGLRKNSSRQDIASITITKITGQKYPHEDHYLRRGAESNTDIELNTTLSVIESFKFDYVLQTELIDDKDQVLEGRSMSRVKLSISQSLKH